MPSELQNRIARAIYESRNGAGCVPWGRRTRLHRAPYMADALAAMKAMREPPLEMIDAGDRAYSAMHTSGVSGMTAEAHVRARCARFSAGWRAAIDTEIDLASGGTNAGR